MNANRRIAVNAIASYLRTLAGIALGLWTSRWVLAALGEVDYGIYQISGIFIVLFSFVSGMISSSSSRFYAYGLGVGGDEASRWVANALLVNLAVAAVFLPTAFFAGSWMVSNLLEIPPDKMPQALFSFRASVAVTAVSIALGPINAMFPAKQEIALQSFAALLLAAARCVCAYLVLTSAGDRLLLCAALFAGIQLAYTVGMAALALAMFRECRRFSGFSREKIRQLLGFSAWNSLGTIANMINKQGTDVAVNKLIGVRFNTTLSISRRVSNEAFSLSQSLLQAMLPEIATSAGRSDERRVRALASRASVFTTFLSSLLAIPIVFNMDWLLGVWLKKVPQDVAPLATLAILANLFSRMACGQGMVLNAKGKIREYQITVFFFVTFPVFVVLAGLAATKSVVSVGIAMICSNLGIVFTEVYWGEKLADISRHEWFHGTLVPILRFLLPALAAAGATAFATSRLHGFVRLLFVSVIGDSVLVILAWRYALPEPVKRRIRELPTRISAFLRNDHSPN